MGILYPDHPSEQRHPLDDYCVALSNPRRHHQQRMRRTSQTLPSEAAIERPRRSSARTSTRSRSYQQSKEFVSSDSETSAAAKPELPRDDGQSRFTSSREARRERRRLSARELPRESRQPLQKKARHNRPSAQLGDERSDSGSARVLGPRNIKAATSGSPRTPPPEQPAQIDVDDSTSSITQDVLPNDEIGSSVASDYENRRTVDDKRPHSGRQTSIDESELSYDYRPPAHAQPQPTYQASPRSTPRRFADDDWRRSHADESSMWDEVEFYKFGRIPTDDEATRRRCCVAWSRRRKWIVFGSAVITIVLIIIIAVAASLSRNKYAYTASDAQVTNQKAFATGGATHQSSNSVEDGTGAGRDVYTYYSGDASNFPSSSEWISFEQMWAANLDTMQNSCQWLHEGSNNSPAVISDIYSAIQDRANASLVDHRFILAVVLQESNGCVLAGQTVSSGGVRNPGLMQSHDGHAYDASHSKLSILWMIQDGTQGTQSGDGLVQYLNRYGNPYEAARGYNSGHIPADGNLSEAAGATACYVSDIANRLTGWVTAKSTCPGDTA